MACSQSGPNWVNKGGTAGTVKTCPLEIKGWVFFRIKRHIRNHPQNGASGPHERAFGRKCIEMAELRTVAGTSETKSGLSTQDLILVAVLLAAGAVLKLTVGSLFSSFGMKPNFIIAMYCLAIILTKPRLGQAVIIGLIAGLICQIPLLNATPLLNIASETLGGLTCGLLLRVPMNIGGKLDVNPFVNTFISTFVSGATFAGIAIYVNVVSTGGAVLPALIAYAVIILGTAAINAVIVQALVPTLRKALAPKASSS